MKIRICLIKDRTYGSRYFLMYKDFLFWHKFKRYYGTLDPHEVIYFDNLEDAEKCANDLLDENKVVIVKEFTD